MRASAARFLLARVSPAAITISCACLLLCLRSSRCCLPACLPARLAAWSRCPVLACREDVALNVYIAMAYFKLDYYDVSSEVLQVGVG